MMLEIFKKESRAFYRFGDLFLLEKIPESHWVKYIGQKFKGGGKNIEEDSVKLMIQMTNNHPDYLQQLCHNVWNTAEKEVSREHIDIAMDLVVRSNALHYQDICEALSNTQLNLVNAILAREKKFTSTYVMEEYHLGTPRNVSKNKKALIEKDIIEIHGETVTFNDPIFEFWLRQR